MVAATKRSPTEAADKAREKLAGILAATTEVLTELEAERTALLARVAEVEGEIAEFKNKIGDLTGYKKPVVQKVESEPKSPSAAITSPPGITLSGLDQYVLYVLSGVEEGKSLTVDQIKEGVEAAGYRSKAANFKMIIHTALHRLKTEKAVAPDKRAKGAGRTAYYHLTAAGRKQVEKLIESGKETTEAEAGEIGEDGDGKQSLENCLLAALQLAKEPAKSSDLANAVLDAGYKTKMEPSKLANAVQTCLVKLKKNGFSKVDHKDGRSQFWVATDKGKRWKLAAA